MVGDTFNRHLSTTFSPPAFLLHHLSARAASEIGQLTTQKKIADGVVSENVWVKDEVQSDTSHFWNSANPVYKIECSSMIQK